MLLLSLQATAAAVSINIVNTIFQVRMPSAAHAFTAFQMNTTLVKRRQSNAGVCVHPLSIADEQHSCRKVKVWVWASVVQTTEGESHRVVLTIRSEFRADSDR
jgi:hypothetical protein